MRFENGTESEQLGGIAMTSSNPALKLLPRVAQSTDSSGSEAVVDTSRAGPTTEEVISDDSPLNHGDAPQSSVAQEAERFVSTITTAQLVEADNTDTANEAAAAAAEEDCACVRFRSTFDETNSFVEERLDSFW
jgi:hypothetical protein